jgi:hypothetical protein
LEFAMAEISNEMYENLRQILEKKNERTYSFDEAKEIGNELVGFYTLFIELDESNENNNEG